MKYFLKPLIFTTIGISLAALFIPHLSSFLALSWHGVRHFYFWQFLSYVLVEPGPISLNFFLQLAINMYLLWIFGIFLMERVHPLKFFLLYFGAALFAGLSALIFPHFVLSGTTNGVYAILIAWMMLNPHSKLFLFSSFPFKSQWLILGILAFTLLMNLSNARWTEAVSLCAASLYSYFFSMVNWKTLGPIPFLHSFEKKILRFLEKKKEKPYQRSKIYDIRSGEPVLDDEQFMEAMFDKISRFGEQSLRSSEKKRMDKIAKRKKRK